MKMKQILPLVMMAAAPLSALAQNGVGIREQNFDKSVKPADDFYEFATGGWQKLNPLPAAFSRFGSFDQLQEDNNKRINTILNDLYKKKSKQGSVEQKLGDFYRLAMDSVRRNNDGVSPVKPLLDEFENAKTLEELRNLQLKYAVFGYGEPLGYGFDADQKDAKNNILNIYQGGLTLGQKEYYLDNDTATVRIRNAYKKFIADMFQNFGFAKADAEQKSQAILRFETMLALISKNNTELRDVEANYNKTTLQNFALSYPNIPLEKMANAQGIDSRYIQSLVLGQPSFLAGLDKLEATETAFGLRARMEWDAMLFAANYLDDATRAKYFDFFSKTMRGTKADYPRWKRATQQAERTMGEALGRIY